MNVLVLLCRSLATLGHGLDLEEMGRRLEGADPAVEVRVVADLCGRPRETPRLADSGAKRLVLGVCSGDHAGAYSEAGLRAAGLDPLGVERVNLGGYCALAHERSPATRKALILLGAAVARARAFPGSAPENVRPQLVRRQQKVSRRALFTLPPIRHRPVASIDGALCVAEAGCRLCVDVCPCDALEKVDRRVAVEKARCQACGLCVSECPQRAVGLPTASMPQVEAEMAALLGTAARASSEPRGLLFVCERSVGVIEGLAKRAVPYPAAWLPLHVPCAGMVPASWLLGALARGARAVGVLGCGVDCTFDQERTVEGKVAYCHDLLRLLGDRPERVRLLRPSPEEALVEALNRPLGEPAAGRATGPALSGTEAAARAILALAGGAGPPPPVSLSHPYSPLGLVEVGAEGCTGCGACAEVCPTGALVLDQKGEAVTLSFDATLCVGCNLCAPSCPEQVVRTEKVTDLRRLAEGRVTLYRDRQALCELCGAAIGPQAMIQRVRGLLTNGGVSSSAAVAVVMRRCPSCRWRPVRSS